MAYHFENRYCNLQTCPADTCPHPESEYFAQCCKEASQIRHSILNNFPPDPNDVADAMLEYIFDSMG